MKTKPKRVRRLHDSYDPNKDANQQLALKFLKTGIATSAELAPLAGVTRQAVHVWALKAGIDSVNNRKLCVRRLWRDAMKSMLTPSNL